METEVMDQKIKLLNQGGKLFEEVSLSIADPEAILFADRVFLPTKKKDTYRECRFDLVGLPFVRSLSGN
jgi:hypothetical protein